jgi:hypothetical protein
MPRFDVSNYVDVQERLVRFWSEYPDGRIDSDLMSLPDEFERVVFKASVYKRLEDAVPAATGWAAEVAGGQGANQTSWHENCETSAIGRALANMGYATSGKDRPSRQEMAKANHQPAGANTDPDPVTPINETQRKRIWALAHEVWPKDPEQDFDPADVNLHDEIGRKWKVTSLNDLTVEQANTYIQRLKGLRAAPTQGALATNAPQRSSAGNDRYTNA